MNDREQVAKLGENPFRGQNPELVEAEKSAEQPTKLIEIDKLRLHNAFLRYNSVLLHRTNIKAQMEVLRRDAATSDVELKKVQEALAKQRECISKDYGVDLQKVTVNEEGEFVPIDPSKMHFPVQGPPNGGN